MEFSHELALALFQSKAPFPVDLEKAWRWIGYKAKRNAKEVLMNNFFQGVDFLRSSTKSPTGGRPSDSIWLTVNCFKSLGMMAGTKKGQEIRDYFLECERIAKQAVETIPAQSQEIERLKLELELLQARQKYQDSGYAIQLSTSPAMLQWLRGEAPPPKEFVYLDRFIDGSSGREVGSSKGRSLTQLITDAGLNPKSKRDKDRVKRALKRWGFDYDRMENWSKASYLREYPVLKDDVYDQALKAVMGEVITGESEQNLFVHQMQQTALNQQKQPLELQGV